jgi:3-phenylpropionate/cinnamic acid dioxygenase small subunit
MAVDDQVERECTRFLYREAELLDQRKLREWLELISPDIDYRVPVRTNREKQYGDGFSSRAFFMEEDYGSLKLRVERLSSDFAWSENPPSRTRRIIGNVRLGSAAGDSQDVVSNLALYCYRGESPTPILLTGERQDTLQRVAGEWKLKTRLVLLDTTVLGFESLSFFL